MAAMDSDAEPSTELVVVCRRCEQRLDRCPHATQCPECGLPMRDSIVASIAAVHGIERVPALLRVASIGCPISLLLLCSLAVRAHALLQIVPYATLIDVLVLLATSIACLASIGVALHAALRIDSAARARQLRYFRRDRVWTIAWCVIALSCIMVYSGLAWHAYLRLDLSPVWGWLVLPFVVTQMLFSASSESRPSEKVSSGEDDSFWSRAIRLRLVAIAVILIAVTSHQLHGAPWRFDYSVLDTRWRPLTALAYAAALTAVIGLATLLLRHQWQRARDVRRTTATRLEALFRLAEACGSADADERTGDDPVDDGETA